MKWTSARVWVALLASALHDEMCSLDDECALERYRWQKMMHAYVLGEFATESMHVEQESWL